MANPLSLLLIVACARLPEAREPEIGERPAVVEALFAGAVGGAAPIAGFEVVAQLDGALVVLDPEGSSVLRAVGPEVRDAVRWEGGALIATADGLFWLGDFLQEASIAGETGPIARVEADEDGVWLGGAGLWRWRSGTLAELRLDGPLDGPFAAGGRLEEGPVLWVSDAAGLYALDGDDAVVEALPRPVASVAATAGGVWATGDGVVYGLEDGRWAAWSLPGAARGALATPGAGPAWLWTDTAIYGADGEIFALTGLPDGEVQALGTDGLGRLVVAAGEGLYRVSDRPAVAIVGLLDGDTLSGETALRLYPSVEGAALSASVGGQPVEVVDEEILLDPYDFLDADEQTLRVSAAWPDGATAESSLRFRPGAPESATWSGEIGPLYQESCANCHGGSTQTVLDTREAWVERIDDILNEVSAERMPLGGPPLSEARVALIRVWRDGGFQE